MSALYNGRTGARHGRNSVAAVEAELASATEVFPFRQHGHEQGTRLGEIYR